MSIRFEVLGSGSQGNCYLVQTEQSNILIDAGFSGKRIIELLSAKSLSISDIHGIFITHEHNDHSAGIRGLSKFSEIQLFANRLTAETINKKLNKNINWHFMSDGEPTYFRDFGVIPFSLPHDAADPVGYVFTKKYPDHETRLCIATDLGYIPYGLPKYTDDANLLILESNHDLNMLEMDQKRPIYIKNRIRGKYGHLSNDSAVSFLLNHNTKNWRKVLLAHLSHDCNSVSCIRGLLERNNLPSTFNIEIIDPNSEYYPSTLLD